MAIREHADIADFSQNIALFRIEAFHLAGPDIDVAGIHHFAFLKSHGTDDVMARDLRVAFNFKFREDGVFSDMIDNLDAFGNAGKGRNDIIEPASFIKGTDVVLHLNRSKLRTRAHLEAVLKDFRLFMLIALKGYFRHRQILISLN